MMTAIPPSFMGLMRSWNTTTDSSVTHTYVNAITG